jgi:glycosyltransferase 2 family protein
MRMSKKLLIPLAVGCLISTLTLYLAFRNVPTDDLLAYLGTINYWWILPTTAIIALTFVLRAYRWIIILRDISDVTFWQAFHPTMIGFMMNCVLPGRVGELARPALLKKNRGIPMTTGLATVAAERIFDLFILIILFALLFSTITGRPDLGGNYFGLHLDSQAVQTVALGMIRLSIALLVCIAILTISRTRDLIKSIITLFGRYLNRLIPRFENPIQKAINLFLKIIDNIAVGLSLVRNPTQLLLCMGVTLLIWALTALSYLIFALGCPGITLSLMEFTTVMVIVCFVIALPSVPGFWGLWEAGGVFALALFGIAEKDALGFTLVNHATQVFPVISIGLISALITSVNIIQITETEPAKNN